MPRGESEGEGSRHPRSPPAGGKVAARTPEGTRARRGAPGGRPGAPVPGAGVVTWRRARAHGGEPSTGSGGTRSSCGRDSSSPRWGTPSSSAPSRGSPRRSRARPRPPGGSSSSRRSRSCCSARSPGRGSTASTVGASWSAATSCARRSSSALPLAAIAFGLSFPLLAATTFLLATASTPFLPARDALLPRLAEGRPLLRFNAAFQTSGQLAQLLGLWLGGALLGTDPKDASRLVTVLALDGPRSS